MPPLDSATINAVLQKQGMPNTTENLNRIAQFAAVAPDLLQQYLGQGTDAAMAGAGTNAAIDRSMAQTDPRLAALAGPNPLSSTLDVNTGRTNIGPGLVNTPEPTGRVGNGAARPAPSNAGRRGVAPNTEPPPGSLPAAAGAGAQAGGFSLDQLLIPLLGPVMAAVVARGRENLLAGANEQPGRVPAMQEAANADPRVQAYRQAQADSRAPPPNAAPNTSPTSPRAPAPYSTDTRTPATNNPTRGSPAVPTADPDVVPRTGPPASGRTTTQTPADIERMKQETARANAQSMSPESGAAAMTEQMKAQQRTRDTLKRAGETVRGRK